MAFSTGQVTTRTFVANFTPVNNITSTSSVLRRVGNDVPFLVDFFKIRQFTPGIIVNPIANGSMIATEISFPSQPVITIPIIAAPIPVSSEFTYTYSQPTDVNMTQIQARIVSLVPTEVLIADWNITLALVIEFTALPRVR
jgi:hypothetical protein